MTIASAIDAARSDALDWDRLDLSKAERIVSRLQARIVKAADAGKWNKVKALQYLLAHSFSAEFLAAERVASKHSTLDTAAALQPASRSV
jgi:RNA-directed DNA polymerase